ncbi:MAG: amidohydrolase/deacetylase family metallohydrolase, partial [candidate division Zixibacteria bacterium]|nr:amidohydrolase/deacetylase family metallohydrolase [candidate division Zixibacteria bacterium]
MFDLLLKGGHVIDPANGIDGRMDVGIAGGRITALDTGIPAEQGKK